VQHSLPTAGVCMFGEAVPEGPHVGIGESKPSHDAPAVGVKHPVWRSSRLAGTLLIVEYDVNGPETPTTSLGGYDVISLVPGRSLGRAPTAVGLQAVRPPTTCERPRRRRQDPWPSPRLATRATPRDTVRLDQHVHPHGSRHPADRRVAARGQRLLGSVGARGALRDAGTLTELGQGDISGAGSGVDIAVPIAVPVC
jgi:hypothetical protein